VGLEVIDGGERPAAFALCEDPTRLRAVGSRRTVAGDGRRVRGAGGGIGASGLAREREGMGSAGER
jgi:hypothetical protein